MPVSAPGPRSDQGALVGVEDHAPDRGADTGDDLLVDERDGGVRREDGGLGVHRRLLPLRGVGLLRGGGDGPVDLLVAEQGEVVAAVAGEVAGEDGDGVAGVEEGVAGADEGVELAGEGVALQPGVLADLQLHL